MYMFVHISTREICCTCKCSQVGAGKNEQKINLELSDCCVLGRRSQNVFGLELRKFKRKVNAVLSRLNTNTVLDPVFCRGK